MVDGRFMRVFPNYLTILFTGPLLFQLVYSSAEEADAGRMPLNS